MFKVLDGFLTLNKQTHVYLQIKAQDKGKLY